MIMEYFGLNEESEGSQQERAQGGHSGRGPREAQPRRAKELQSSGREDQLPRSGQPVLAVLGEGGSREEDVEPIFARFSNFEEACQVLGPPERSEVLL